MDLGLTMGWDIVSIGDGVAQSAVAAGGRCCGNVSFSRLLQITCGDMETAQASLEPGHERHVDQPRQHRGRDVCPRQQHRYSPQSLGGGGQAAK